MKYTADWTTPHTTDWTKALGHLKDKEAHGIEIGCREGRSSIWFLKNILTHPRSTLLCIDPFESGIFDRFKANLSEAKVTQKVTLYQKKSEEVHLINRQSVDFAYVDGNHISHHAMYDALLCWWKLKVGGVLIFDDYGWKPMPPTVLPDHMLPQAAIDSFCQLMGPAFRVILTGNGPGKQVIGIKMR